MTTIPSDISKQAVIDRLSSWSPEEGKPFDWLPDHTFGSGMVWYNSLSEEVRQLTGERIWFYAEFRYGLHLVGLPLKRA